MIQFTINNNRPNKHTKTKQPWPSMTRINAGSKWDENRVDTATSREASDTLKIPVALQKQKKPSQMTRAIHNMVRHHEAVPGRQFFAVYYGQQSIFVRMVFLVLHWEKRRRFLFDRRETFEVFVIFFSEWFTTALLCEGSAKL